MELRVFLRARLAPAALPAAALCALLLRLVTRVNVEGTQRADVPGNATAAWGVAFDASWRVRTDAGRCVVHAASVADVVGAMGGGSVRAVVPLGGGGGVGVLFEGRFGKGGLGAVEAVREGCGENVAAGAIAYALRRFRVKGFVPRGNPVDGASFRERLCCMGDVDSTERLADCGLSCDTKGVYNILAQFPQT